MRLPAMKYADRIQKNTQVKFLGLNRTLGAGDGELWDMRNLTSDHAPVLAVREKRKKIRTLASPGGLYCWGELAWVDGDGFYYGGERKGTVTAGMKTFASLGDDILIFPDKCRYNITTGEFGSLEERWNGASAEFGNGKLYGEEAEANALTAAGAAWAGKFRVGDSVTISGCTVHPENNKTAIIRGIEGDTLYFYENTFTLTDAAKYKETGELTVARLVPDLKYLCENENRLWGCDDRTVYACKLGDPFNWYVYDGLATDAWAVTPGSPGGFTGCTAYKGYAIFAKEDHIYKIYGSVPSSFSMAGSASLGVAEGSGGSIAVAGETMFYLNNNGVMAYSGGIPQSIGTELGTGRFRSAVGGSDGLKYYVSMEGPEGWGLWVYDTQRNLWYREDDTRVTHFARLRGELYLLNDRGEIWCVNPSEETSGEWETEITWMAEFADFTDDSPDKKTPGELQVRLELEEGADVRILIQYDSDGRWQELRRISRSDGKRSYQVPVVPRRCDHYRVKLEGSGGCSVWSVTRSYSVGSAMKSKPGRY